MGGDVINDNDMKRILFVAIFFLFALPVMAQTSLDGFWKTTQKSNGLTIKETLCFEGDTCGKAKDVVYMGMLVMQDNVVINGEVKITVEGEFSLKDNKLVITWNPFTVTDEYTKEPIATVQGQPNSMYTASVKQSFDAIVAGSKINITNNSTDTYNVVAIEKGKMTLSQEVNGQVVEQVYKRLKKL